MTTVVRKSYEVRNTEQCPGGMVSSVTEHVRLDERADDERERHAESNQARRCCDSANGVE